MIENQLIPEGAELTILDDNLNEAFKAGTSQEVMKKLAKVLEKKVPFELDLDMSEGYRNSSGSFRGYYGYTSGLQAVRLNFALESSDRIYSVDLFDDYADTTPRQTIIFDVNANIVQISRALIELIAGTLEECISEGVSGSTLIEAKKMGRKTTKQGVLSWLLCSNLTDQDVMGGDVEAEKEKRIDMIQTQRLNSVFQYYSATITLGDGEKMVGQSTFTNTIKDYLLKNKLKNAFQKGAYSVQKGEASIPIILPEEASAVEAMGDVNQIMFSWRDAWFDMEDDFHDMMKNPNTFPFGQLVYGNGGTGKSYFFEQQWPKYDSVEPFKGAIPAKGLIEILYKNRDKELLIFDDADSVITNPNSMNVLKAGLTDTGARRITVTSKTGVFKGFKGNDFTLKAKVVIITNLNDLKDKALKTRLYVSPLFMKADEIIEKVTETIDYKEMGATKSQANQVADFMKEMVLSGGITLSDEELSYRFFKQSLTIIRRGRSNWKEPVMRNFGIGVRTSNRDLAKRGKR